METIRFKDLDITINSGELIGIIGPIGSGKTNILNKLSGIKKNTDILIDNKLLKQFTLDYKRKNIVCVSNNNIFNTPTPLSELRYYLYKIGMEIKEIDYRIKEFKDFFKLDNILKSDFEDMSLEDRNYIKILSLLIIKPSIFCIDDLLTYLNRDKKTNILNYIKANEITLLNITSDMEELFLYDKILVMNKGYKYDFDLSKNILKNEKLFKDLGLNMPFIYDLNIMLKEYGLINELHIVHKELIDLLWK